MFTSHSLDQVNLSPNDLLALTPAQPTALHVRSGTLWVTQAGDYRDHFLRAGQTMQLASGRLTVFQAEGVSVQASLASAAKHSAKRRLWKEVPKFWSVGLKFSA